VTFTIGDKVRVAADPFYLISEPYDAIVVGRKNGGKIKVRRAYGTGVHYWVSLDRVSAAP
jgi:hypothetical protein